jgi:hypothetical protein
MSNETFVPVTPDTTRRHPRYGVALRVQIRPDTWDHTEVVYSSDISLGGLFLRMSDPLPVGALLTVTFFLRAPDPLSLRAEVRHALPPDAARVLGRRAGVGVKFVDPTPAQRARLADLVDNIAGGHQRATAAVVARLVPRRAPGAQDAVDADAAPLVAELRGVLDDLELRDYFELLGVAPDASAGEVRQRFLTVSRPWHPQRFAAAPDAVRAVVSEIHALLRRAQDTLIDPERRAEYLDRLGRGVPRRAPVGGLSERELFGDLPPAPAEEDVPLNPALFEPSHRERIPFASDRAPEVERLWEHRLRRALERARAAEAAGAVTQATAHYRDALATAPEHPAAVAGLRALGAARRAAAARVPDVARSLVRRIVSGG